MASIYIWETEIEWYMQNHRSLIRMRRAHADSRTLYPSADSWGGGGGPAVHTLGITGTKVIPY